MPEFNTVVPFKNSAKNPFDENSQNIDENWLTISLTLSSDLLKKKQWGH